ncbi:hypothetical protein K438DRAFT_1954121 [Mycena galopus ATCC 62051]|nr:hypothetical protein K438DRAFT_1954121 [Mycena galopus ATCC 62051]
MFFQTATYGRSCGFTLTSILVNPRLSALTRIAYLGYEPMSEYLRDVVPTPCWYLGTGSRNSHLARAHTHLSQQGPQHASRQSRATPTPYTRTLASLYGIRTDDAVPSRTLARPRSTTCTAEHDAAAPGRARRLPPRLSPLLLAVYRFQWRAWSAHCASCFALSVLSLSLRDLVPA